MSEKLKIDLETGLKERSIDIETVIKLANIPGILNGFKGPDIFSRLHSAYERVEEQHNQ